MTGITRPVGGPIPNPNRDEVLLVQRLLNQHRPPPLCPIAVDGLVGPETGGAIWEFQQRVVKSIRADGRVDPGGPTFRALSRPATAPVRPPAGPPAGPPSGLVTVVFKNWGKQPTGVMGLPGADVKTTATRYESTVTVSGGSNGTFHGSIYPDNMNVKGRLKDGTYDIYLGFHHSGTPTPADLVPRTNGFRAVLIVNANGTVPVVSNNPAKMTSSEIHIHNGYYTWKPEVPMSEGCLILAPDDWKPFITLFLNAFPDLADWTAGGGRLGKKVGVVTVTP